MKKIRSILFLLLSALMCSCGKPEIPPPDVDIPATYVEGVTPETQEVTVQSAITEAITQAPTTQPVTEEIPTEPSTTENRIPTLPLPAETQDTVPTLPLPTETQDTVPTLPLPTETQDTVPTLPFPTENQNSAATSPLPTTAPSVTPPGDNVSVCSHNYQPGIYQAPTCQQAGYQSYRCVKCGDVQQQISLPLEHRYEDATCTTPKRCILCDDTQGSPLGHSFSDRLCSRCGQQDPSVRIITIQVKDNKNNPVDGVSVALYIADQLHSTSISSSGKVTFTVQNHSGSYTLALTGIPEGYKAQKNSYTYRSDSGAIVLDIVAVISPEDHSKATYRVGSTMVDFTVTDVDGKTHQLSRLLTENKLVILNFWYYTCVPCKAEFPFFNSVYEKYSDHIEILALNHFDDESKITQLRSEMGLLFPLATENLGMQQGFSIQSYPMSVFIDSSGRILKIQKDIGFQSEAELETVIRQMLGV